MHLKISVSKIIDGSMKSLDSSDTQAVTEARNNFILKNNICPSDTTLVRLSYDDDNFKRYFTVDDSHKGDGITQGSSFASDAIVTTQKNHAIFLPLADCIGAVLFDSIMNVMMVSHLGRHSLEQFGGVASVEYLIKKHNLNPKNIKVWLSPAAGKTSYPLLAFDNHSMHEVATDQLVSAGILLENIDISPIDSANNLNYYSHSQFLKGKRATDGRFAILAVMTDK